MKYAQWRMPGGVHPPEHKQESSRTPIQDAGLPPRLIIPLIQHIGEEARPIVQVGDHVLFTPPPPALSSISVITKWIIPRNCSPDAW